MDNIREGIKANLTKTDIGVPVFSGAANILAVVDMEDCNLIFPEKMVKIFNDTIKIMDDIVTTVMSMAGVEAYPKLLVISDTIVNTR